MNENDHIADEYDGYADHAYMMLMVERKSQGQIADYLYRAASEHMGLAGRTALREHCDTIATRLVELLPTFEAESNEPF